MSSTTDRRPFPLLSLPPELRDQIYTYLLSTQHPIDIFRYQKRYTCTKSSDFNEENPGGIHIPVAILRTCRQIQAEATPILYSINRFVFNFARVLKGFIKHSRASRWMKDVDITHPCSRGDVLEALKALETRVEKLQRLALGGAIRKVFGAGEIAGELVGMVRNMGEVSGDGTAERTLSRVIFLADAGYQTRALAKLAERNRMVYEEQVKVLLRQELEDGE